MRERQKHTHTQYGHNNITNKKASLVKNEDAKRPCLSLIFSSLRTCDQITCGNRARKNKNGISEFIKNNFQLHFGGAICPVLVTSKLSSDRCNGKFKFREGMSS